jgi:hypothetical protein
VTRGELQAALAAGLREWSREQHAHQSLVDLLTDKLCDPLVGPIALYMWDGYEVMAALTCLCGHVTDSEIGTDSMIECAACHRVWKPGRRVHCEPAAPQEVERYLVERYGAARALEWPHRVPPHQEQSAASPPELEPWWRPVARRSSPPAGRSEYKTLTFEQIASPPDGHITFVEGLNRQAARGWDLVTTTEGIFVFRRTIADKEST